MTFGKNEKDEITATVTGIWKNVAESDDIYAVAQPLQPAGTNPDVTDDPQNRNASNSSRWFASKAERESNGDWRAMILAPAGTPLPLTVIAVLTPKVECPPGYRCIDDPSSNLKLRLERYGPQSPDVSATSQPVTAGP